ncbi:MAG: SDR family NAD(P)-dependent oxidoreductase [Terriglobia bacterium]
MAYALVTGASSGIGECFARQLARRRKDLVLTARSEDKLKALCEEFSTAAGVRAEAMAADLAEPKAAERLVRSLRQREIEIDLLVNNAGFGAQGRFWTIPFERQAGIIRLNVEALLELTYLLAPAMVAKRQGGVINVSSTASFQPLPYTAVYAASKSFVTSFSMGLAEELRPYGVKVVTLCPGTTETNFFKAGDYRAHRLRGKFQSPDAVAKAGLRQLDRGGGLVLARNIDKAMVFAERFLPRGWVARSAGAIFKVD